MGCNCLRGVFPGRRQKPKTTASGPASATPPGPSTVATIIPLVPTSQAPTSSSISLPKANPVVPLVAGILSPAVGGSPDSTAILVPPHLSPVTTGGQLSNTATTKISPVSAPQVPALGLTPPSTPRPTPPLGAGSTTPPGAGAQSTTPPPSLWDQALAKLQPEDVKGIDLTKKDRIEILQEFINGTEAKKKECEDKQWSYKNSQGEKVYLRSHVDALLTQLNKYALIGNVAIQHNPDVVALAWAGFRLLLQVATSDMEVLRMVFESLEYLVRILGRCDIYEKLYSRENLTVAQTLNDSLLNLYVSALEYLCCARRHLTHNTATRFLKSLSPELKDYLDKVKGFEERVEEDAGVAEKEVAGIRSSAQKVEVRRLQELLAEIQKPIFQIDKTVTDIYTSIQDEKRQKILTWLSNVTFKSHHTFVQESRHKDTGEWLLKNNKYLGWKDSSSSSILWLHGIAGSGKTMLASRIIDDLPPEPKNHAIAYFYCNFKEESRRDPEIVLRTLIKQLCLANTKGTFPQPVLSIHEKRVEDGDLGPLNLKEIKELFIQLSAGFSRTTILIDALDECDKSTRKKLVDVLKHAITSSNLVRVFVTSRDDGDLVHMLSKTPSVYIEAANNSSDISKYINSEIECCIKDGSLLRGKVSPDLKETIVSALVKGACGMFIWVKFQILSICKEVTPAGVKNILGKLPKDLDDTYTEIMQRITDRSEDTSRIAKKVLMWLLYTNNPLSSKAIIEAISMQPMESDLDTDGLSQSVILDVCQNLVVFDNELGVLRFAHFSVQEFLLRQPEFSASQTAHTIIADVCLTLLTFHSAGELALMEYSISNWAAHLRLSGIGSSFTETLWKGFLRPSPAYEAWYSELSIWELKPKKFEVLPPLLVACYYELWDIFRFLLEAGTDADANSSNKNGRTPLHHAAGFGYTNAVQLLLKKEGVDVDSKDTEYGRTPLSWAAKNGHEKVVQMLLEKGVDVDSKCKSGRTPLSWAAENGHEKVVQMLLEKGVNVDSKDIEYGQTPLSWAAWNGHEKVVQMLLDKGVDVESKDTYHGRTPLSLAAKNGHEKVVQMLLEKGVNVDSKDIEYGRTPLSWAAKNGHEKVVQMLLEKAVDVDSKDTKYGRTPLSLAAKNGHEKVVQMLLEKGVNVDSKDIEYGQTPLSLAAKNGHEKVVQMLLDKGVDVDSKDTKYGQTPLSWAAKNGHEKVVQMLLEKGVDVDSKCKSGRTPLSWAAENGHEKVVQMLLEKGVDVDSKDTEYGRTPLSWAAKNGHEKVVQMLLDKGVDVDSKDTKFGRTPLSWAALNGHEKVVQMLLDKGVDVESKDTYYGQTPLSWAAKNGHEKVVQMLLDKGVDVESKDIKYGQTPLSWAAEKGLEKVVQMLLDKGVDVDSKDNNGMTALDYAFSKNQEKVKVLIMERLSTTSMK